MEAGVVAGVEKGKPMHARRIFFWHPRCLTGPARAPVMPAGARRCSYAIFAGQE
jgi:hypothetical protein